MAAGSTVMVDGPVPRQHPCRWTISSTPEPRGR
jgi:hypothetical protein